MPSKTPPYKTTMFFDGGCPLCSREVAHYRRIDTKQNVMWADIDRDPSHLVPLGVSKDQAMKHLHVLNSEGELLIGASAFAAVWRELPYYRVLATLVSPAPVLRILDKAYYWFAERRYARRISCNSDQCSG